MTLGGEQAYIFYIFILTGLLIGFLFDIFRVLRRSFKTSDIITYIQDIIFWILAGALLIYSIFKFNNGEIRSYVVIGLVMGIMLYLTIFSKLVIKVNVAILTFLKKLIIHIIRIILYPAKILLKLLMKIILKPISFIFINIRKNIKDSLNKMSKLRFKPKNFKKKVKNMQ